MTGMLLVDDLRTRYGSVEVLKGVALRVDEGEIVTLIGANGAGKSTLLMTISGSQPIHQGQIHFLGERIDRLAPEAIASRGILQVPEGRRIFSRLTVRENLEMGAYLEKDSSVARRNLKRVFELFPILEERSSQPGGTLSGGEQQMLAIGRALMGNPRLLLLDEPSLGLAPQLVSKIFRVIAELNRSGTTILLVEQNAQAALRLANRAYVIETGQITISGKASELCDDPKVQSAYLGA